MRKLTDLDQQIEEFVSENGPCAVSTVLTWFCAEGGKGLPEGYVRGRCDHLVFDDASPLRFDELLRLTTTSRPQNGNLRC